MPSINDYRNKFPSLRALDDDALIQRVAEVQGVDPQDVIAHMGYKPPKEGWLPQAGNLALGFGQGAVQGVRMLTDVAGADNPVSGGLRTVEEFIGGLQSAGAKRDRAEISRILQEAEGAGVLNQVIAGVRAFGVAPGQMIAQVAGTMAPTVAAAMVPGGQALLAGRLAPAAVGAAQGVGNIKGNIYEEVGRGLTEAGATPEEAAQVAAQAQSYTGPNTGQIALGGALGALAGGSGVERVAQSLMQGARNAAPGAARRIIGGAAAEAGPEALQGGQEKFATNTALANEGFNVDPMAGVYSSATMEGMAGGLMGGALGIAKPRTQVEQAAQADQGMQELQTATTPDEAVAAAMKATSVPLMQRAQDALRPAPDAVASAQDARRANAPILSEIRQLDPEQQSEAIRLASLGTSQTAPAHVRRSAQNQLDAMPAPVRRVPTADATEFDAVPAGEATEMAPVGEATEFKGIPAGQAAAIDAEVIEPQDLTTQDGMPYGAQSGAVVRAKREGLGIENIVKVAGGWVVRPQPTTLGPAGQQVQPNNTRGTTAADVVKPTAAPQPAEPALTGKSSSEKVTPGRTFTMDGKPYTVVSAGDGFVAIRGPEGNAQVVLSRDDRWPKVQKALTGIETGPAVGTSAQPVQKTAKTEQVAPTLRQRVDAKKAANAAPPQQAPEAARPEASPAPATAGTAGQAAADTGAASGGAVEAGGVVRPVKRGDDLPDNTVIRDQQGRTYRVHQHRNLLIVAHPIVDGKAQVSRDTTVRFRTDGDQLDANERGDPVFVVSRPGQPQAQAKAPVAEPADSATPVVEPKAAAASDKPARRTEARGTATHPKTVMGSRLLAEVSKANRGIHPSLLSEFSERVETARKDRNGRPLIQWRNPLIPGVGRLFRASGTSDYSEIAETLEAAGYLEPGSVERDYKKAGERAREMVRAALQRQDVQTLDEQIAEQQASEEAERQAYYAEVDAQAAAELEAEREAIMNEEGFSRAEIAAFTDDDLTDFDAPLGAVVSMEEGMRAMGFTEQEIADELAKEEARGTAKASAAEAGANGPEEAAAAAEDRGAAARADTQAEGLTLEAQDAEGLRARADREARAAADDAKEQRRLADKAKADAERDEFTLTGSDRAVDVGAAAGQGGLFDAPAAPTHQAAADKPAAGVQATIQDVGEKIGGARKDTAVSTGTTRRKSDDDRPAWARRFQVSEIVTPGGMLGEVKDAGRWIIRDTKSLDWSGQAKQVGRTTFATKEEADAFVPIAAVGLKHRPVPTSDGKYEIWRDISDRKRVKVVEQQFDTREEAMAYMAQNAVAIVETNTTFGEADLPLPPDRKRTGPARRNGDVRGEDFKETFGLRGVEFGNWNNQDERQALMNDAWDGLMDLADVMGIPPKAIGLNGDLALAFGARGHGLNSARAHYELDRAVINLTKERGAGSLAHEWFHALDHYFGRQDGKASATWVINKDGTRSLKTSSDATDDLASGGFTRNRSGVRPEVRAAYEKLLTTMTKRAETYVEDMAKVDKFTGATREELASALDSLRRDLSEQKDVRYWKRNNKPASAELLAEFDAIAKAMIDGDMLAITTDWTTVKVPSVSTPTGSKAVTRWTNDSLERLSAIYKQVRGRSGFDGTNQNGLMDRLRGNMNRYSQRLKMLAEAQSGTEKQRMVPTEFAREARELDQGRGGDYWTTPHEMAARAFQGYVEDKIATQGGTSRFLNYGPENAGILTPWGFKRPYPTGAERIAINKALDEFVGELKTRTDDAGNVALYSRTGSRAETNALKALSENDELFALPRSAADLRTALEAEFSPEAIGVLEQAGLLTIADRPGRGMPADAAGVTQNGTIGLFAANTTQGSTAVAYHEALHATLRATVGEATYTALMDRLAKIDALAKSPDSAVNRFFKQAAGRIPDDVTGEARLEELAAYSVEQYQADRERVPSTLRRWVEDLMAALRAGLAKALQAAGIGMKLRAKLLADPATLRKLARDGLQAMARQGMGQGMAPAFSRDTTRSMQPDDELEARSIIEIHPPRDRAKLATLVAGMQESGWEGRPILVWDNGNGTYALTGSHRLAAAKKADIAVPVVYVDADLFSAALEESDQTFDDVIGSGDDRVASLLREAGDTRAADLMDLEIDQPVPDSGGAKYSRALGAALTGKPPGKLTVQDLSRIGAKMAAQGYEPAEVPNLQATRKLAALVRRLEQGEISEPYFAMAVRNLALQMQDVSDTKAANRLMRDRERGADIVRERLIRARRQGDINPEAVDFALWALDKNPALAERLAISVRTPTEGGTAGDYNPAAEIVRLFKGADNVGTAVHEILHHAERMMTPEMQSAIRGEWAKALAKAIKNATPEQREALGNVTKAIAGDLEAYKALVKAIQQGPLNYDQHYQLINPSEFWAVNATRLLGNRFATKDSVWQRIGVWLDEAISKLKGLLGLRSDAPILRGLEAVMASDGSRQSDLMLTDAQKARFFDISRATGKLTAQDLLNAKGGIFSKAGETKADRVRAISEGARPFWLGAMTRDQIADMYGDEIPPVRDYDNLTRQMENERQGAAQKAEELYEEWSKIDAEVNDRLARVMLDATVAQVHPDKDDPPARATEEQRQAHAMLRAKYRMLPKDAQAMYAKVRDFHAGTLADLRKALEGRIARLIENRAERAVALADIRKRFDQYMQGGPYFPLHRFGDFLVIANRDSDGERVVAAYENAGEQAAAARALEADGFSVKLQMAKKYNRAMDGSAGKFIGDVLQVIDKMDMKEARIGASPTSMKEQLLDDLNQLFIKALPDLSYRKHFTHRKNTAGFSADVMRGFASSAFHAAGHIARLNHGDKMTFALEDAYKQIESAPEGDFTKHSQILGELAQRHDAALNPDTHPLSAAATQVGFVMYLGLSPAAGLINMLQVPMVALPYIGARYGFTRATAAMGKAYADIMGAKPNAKSGFNAAQSPKLSADERRAISTLQEEGVIDLTQAHDLASATSRDVGNQARSRASFAIARAMRIVGWTFHVPEVMNRQVTALMAYRLEMGKSANEEKAMDAAREAIKRSQFDYSASNRARYMQGNVARVVTQFKQFSQNMTYFLGRAAYQALKDESPEVRRIARNQLLSTFMVTGAMAGSLGLPGVSFFAGLVQGLVNALQGDDEEPWDWKTEYRNMLADKEWGEFMARGVPRALMPAWDISGRVSLSDLWWRDGGREGENPREAFANDMGNILGPTAGTILGWYTAADHMARGDYSKAVESVVPKFIRDPLKAVREGQEGITSYTGEPLMELTTAEIIGRFSGFAPARASEMFEGRNAVMNAKTALDERRQRLVSQMAKARIDGDMEAVDELRERIANWNRANPQMQITSTTIARSMMNRRRNTANTEQGITLPDSKDFLRERARFAEVG